MKASLLALAAILVTLCTPKTTLAATGDHYVGLGMGQVILMGDFGEYVNDSIGFKLQHQYDASELFGVLTHISMSSHSNADDTNQLSIKGLSPNLKANLAYFDKLVLFMYTGFGLFNVSQTIGALKGSIITIAYNLGGGFDLALNDHFLFGTTLEFHNLFGKTDTAATNAAGGTGRMSVGGTYLDLTLNVKYMF